MRDRMLILMVVLVASLGGCGNKKDQPSPPPSDQSGNTTEDRPPAECVEGTFCPRGNDKFILREKWKNVGDLPIRTLYMNISVYNKEGKKVFGAKDYPIYSVPDSEPGVLPGQTYTPGGNEGFVIPFGCNHLDASSEATGRYTRATEKGIR
jgi:hypothetical protein